MAQKKDDDARAQGFKRGLKGNILLAVNRLSPGKGLEDLIKALPAVLQIIPDTQLVLVGEDFQRSPYVA